jgi:hypothetical protein
MPMHHTASTSHLQIIVKFTFHFGALLNDKVHITWDSILL